MNRVFIYFLAIMFLSILLYPLEPPEITHKRIISGTSCYVIDCLDRPDPLENRKWNYFIWKCSLFESGYCSI